MRRLKQEATQHDSELLKAKDEISKHEAELMRLREETSKHLDEITQMEDEKETADLFIKRLEEQKLELEDMLKDGSGGGAAEKAKMQRKIDDLEDELDQAHDLCEERRYAPLEIRILIS